MKAKCVALIEFCKRLKGKPALEEFRKSNSEWRIGDVYLFGENLQGTVWINVALPKLEGTNVSGLKDANGKLFHMEMAKTGSSLFQMGELASTSPAMR